MSVLMLVGISGEKMKMQKSVALVVLVIKPCLVQNVEQC